MKRGWACFWIFLVTGIVGVFASLSFGPLSGVHFFGKGFFDFLDTFSSNFLLTIGGFLCVVFVGWKMSKANVKDEFTNGGKKKLNEKIFGVAYFLMKYLAPIAVAIIFVTNLIL